MYSENIHHYLQKNGFENFSPKAVLFDMDGVIYDSMPAHAIAWEQAMKHYNLEFSQADTYANEGMRGEEVVARCIKEQWGRESTPEEEAEIYNYKASILAQMGERKKMPGTIELMEKIKAAGLQILVVTGSGQPSLLSKLVDDHQGLISPQLIISSKDCTKGKPDPQPYLLGLERANVKPWEAIVVENAPMGVHAAVAAKIFTIGVNTGPLPDEMLLSEGADIVLKPMTALRDTINHLIGK